MNGSIPSKQQPTVHVTSASSMASFVPAMTSSPNHRSNSADPAPSMNGHHHLNGHHHHLAAPGGVVSSPGHRNSTGSTGSQASSGFESMKVRYYSWDYALIVLHKSTSGLAERGRPG